MASIQGVTALTSSNEADQHLWATSGGKRLCEAIQHQVASGRSADIDSAQMVLAKFGHRGSPALPAQQLSQKQQPAINPAPHIEPVSAQDTAAPAQTVATQADATADILTKAVNVLSQSGQDLLREIDGDAPINTDAILDQCASSIAALSSQLGSSGSADPAIQEAAAAAQDGEEMMILLRMERGEDAALDAVTLMLQMRKELTAQASA